MNHDQLFHDAERSAKLAMLDLYEGEVSGMANALAREATKAVLVVVRLHVAARIAENVRVGAPVAEGLVSMLRGEVSA